MRKRKEKSIQKKIIKNALKIFTKKGFFRTTVDEIAKTSGIAKGTVYLYFKDKASLYVDIIQEYFASGMIFLKEVKEKPLSSTEKLMKIADNWIDYMIQLKSSFFMFTMENLNLSRKIMKAIQPLVSKNIGQMIDIIAGIIDEGIKSGEFCSTDTRIAALHFLNTIRTGFYVKLLIPEISVERAKSLDLFFNGLKKRR